jgi:Ran GTPase-activating protein (RanGAP) involved in mRNA processing and transport
VIGLDVNSIGPVGVKSVAEALKVNSTLQTIDLLSNWIRNEGAKALAEAVKVNRVLQKIKLGVNDI